MDKINLTNSINQDDFAELFATIPFNRTMGATLHSVKADAVTVEFDMKKELVGNFFHGILHGGVISAALDAAAGAAVLANALRLYPDKSKSELTALLSKTSRIDLNVHFLRPGKGERFIVKAWVTHRGNKLSFARMELYNQAELLIATGSATYLLG